MSFVYFVHAPSVALVKIGRSTSPDRRLSELRQLSPVPLSLLGMMLGRSGIELLTQRRFKAHHSHGEWFHETPELLEFARNPSIVGLGSP